MFYECTIPTAVLEYMYTVLHTIQQCDAPRASSNKLVHLVILLVARMHRCTSSVTVDVASSIDRVLLAYV